MPKDDEIIVATPPNDGPPVDCVWMFVSRDEQGRENVCGSLMGYLGTQPMITGNPRTLELMTTLAREMRKQLPPDRTMHLLKFTNREEVENW
jgi:hypothetical protein